MGQLRSGRRGNYGRFSNSTGNQQERRQAGDHKVQTAARRGRLEDLRLRNSHKPIGNGDYNGFGTSRADRRRSTQSPAPGAGRGSQKARGRSRKSGNGPQQ